VANSEFDRLLESIRADAGEDRVREAWRHVRARLEGDLGESALVDRLNSCNDFRALFASYRNGLLSEARRMLVEDHLHSCVACRRLYQGPPTPAVLPERRQFHWVRWGMAAAAVIAVGFAISPMLDRVLAGTGPRATVASVTGELYRVAGATTLKAGAPIAEGEEIRTGKDSRAVVRLRDGSTLEMAERSDLRISERFSGKTVRLDRGAVMVEAARQRRGRLQIATADCLVSVKGTIFEVTAGTKGSRVSVVEGEVKVDRDGITDTLHRGQQQTTSPAMQTTSVSDDVAWSRNAAKYLALLGEFSTIQKRIEQLPSPALRYKSTLAGLLPENTMVFAAIPNLGPTLKEATGIFEDRVAQNAALREWWNQKHSRQLRTMVDQVRAFSDYLGNEIVLAMPAGSPGPVLVAEERRPGLKAFLEKELAPANVPQAPTVMVHGNVVAVGFQPAMLHQIADTADAGGAGPFLKTPFWNAISRSYKSGAEWIFAADMEQILARHVTSSGAMAGLDNVGYLMIERKPNLGRTENSATLSFAGERHGMASWLAAPGPMGTLDFVSPQASFAGSFVIKNPATLLTEVMALAGPQFRQQAGVQFLNGIAANVGGEVTIAVDGPLLPAPSWKIAIEVEDPGAIEAAVEQAASAAGTQIQHTETKGRTYSTLILPRLSYQIDYTFTDGYLLIAPSPALLTSAIETRATGITLAHSAAFRAQLPQDGHVNFSGLLYYNAGVQLGPIFDQLKSSGLMTPEQQQSIGALAANRQPGLIYAYGEPDHIFVGSRGGFFGLGLDTLLGLNAKGAAALPQLFLPLWSIHGSRH